MKRYRIFIFVGILPFLFDACKKEKPAVNFHFGYFGLEKGRFVEYDVTHIYHDDDLGVHETTYYQIKTLVGDPILDNSGRMANEFFRFQFDSIYQEYKPTDLWTAIIDQTRAELVEENQRKIKLVFAPSEFKEWNINAFNSLSSVNAYYSNIHQASTIGNFSFDSTVTVEEDSVSNLVEFRRKYEVYAKGVGMIKKHYQDLKIKNFDKLNPTEGEEFFYTVINYGKQ